MEINIYHLTNRVYHQQLHTFPFCNLSPKFLLMRCVIFYQTYTHTCCYRSLDLQVSSCAYTIPLPKTGACTLFFPSVLSSQANNDSVAIWVGYASFCADALSYGHEELNIWLLSNCFRFLNADYMCCNASWACSVYTSSFTAHELKLSPKCAPRWEARCLSREKKLNLTQEWREEEKGQRLGIDGIK